MNLYSLQHVKQHCRDYYADDDFPIQFQENATYLHLKPGNHSSSWGVVESISPKVHNRLH